MPKIMVTLALVANLCDAASIVGPDAHIQWSGPNSTSRVTSAVLENAISPVSDLQLSATVCADPFCTEDFVGPPILTTDPLTVRTTNFTLACTFTGLMCGPENITITYRWSFADPLAGTIAPVALALNGTAPPGYSLELFGGAETVPLSPGSEGRPRRPTKAE